MIPHDIPDVSWFFWGAHLRPGLIQWAEPADGSVHTALLRFFQAFDKDPRGMVGAITSFHTPSGKLI